MLVTSICSLLNAKSFAFCSERIPSICASTPASSFNASICATLNSTLFLSFLRFSLAIPSCILACDSIAFSASFIFIKSSSFAFFLSVILFLSSSLICLNFSACLSNFSNNNPCLAAANSADFCNSTFAFAALTAALILTSLNSLTTTLPTSESSVIASPKLLTTSLPACAAASPTSKIFFLVSIIDKFKALIVSGSLSPKKLFSQANIAVSIPNLIA